MNEHKQISRRSFLAYVGSGTATLLAASSGLGLFSGKAAAAENPKALFSYPSAPLTAAPGLIAPSDQDELILPKGFQFQVLAAYGDPINAKGDTFGFNNSYTCYHPLDGSAVSGVLWVNHESADPLWVQGERQNGSYTPSQMQKLLYNLGASILSVYRDADGNWKLDTASPYARRITGLDAFEFTGPARGAKSVYGAARVQGTIGSGSGGKTLWGTQLSGERSFGEPSRDLGLPQTHYGWVTEADPFDAKFKLRKHTALGRFQHGSISMGLSKEGQVVVYMGDGAAYACIYKYISKDIYIPAKGTANAELLADGTLYAADLIQGRWVPLTIQAVRDALGDLQFRVPAAIEYTREELLELFKEEADVYVYAGEAALILGATPTDHPETVQLSPEEGTVFITHTGNVRHGNLHGQISRLMEKAGNLGAMEFTLETMLSGGRQGELSSPDSLIADHLGNLWVSTNMPAGQLNQGAYADFKNNGLFAIVSPVSSNRRVLQFASAPNDAALVGPCFTPDERSMFVAVQHPGATTSDAGKPSSRWGSRPGSTAPRPAVVAISGFNY